MTVDPLATEKTPAFAIDLTESVYKTLSEYAGRIGKLPAVPAVRAAPDLAGCLDDFLGAVYACGCLDVTDRLPEEHLIVG